MGAIFSPAPFAHVILVIFVLFSEIRLTTLRAPFSDITLIGVCWNCFPVSSQFQMRPGLSCMSCSVKILLRSSKYFDTTVVFSILAREFPSCSGFLIVISGWRFLRPSHHPLPGMIVLNGVTLHLLAQNSSTGVQFSSGYAHATFRGL